MPIAQLLAIFIFLTFNVPVYGETNGLDGTIRVGIFPFNPINYTDKNGSAKGLNPDLLREIFRDDTTHLEFVPGSWSEGLKRLQDEEIDMMMSVGFSEERAEVMDYGRESVLQLWGQVFVRPDHHSQNISDFFNKKIGVMRRDISGRNFITTIKELGGSCQIVEYESHDEVFQAVLNGQVDGGVAPQHFGLRHAAEYDLIGTSILFSPFSIYFTCKKGFHRNILDHIDTHLAEWKKDQNSAYYEILHTWMAPVGHHKTVPTWLLPAFLIVFLTALASICFILLLNSSVKKKTRKLQESESRFRDAVLNISDWIWEIDDSAICTYCSEHSFNLLGYPPEELIGQSLFDIMAPEGVEEARRFFEEMMSSGKTYRNREQLCICKDGSEIHLLTSAVPIVDDSGKILGNRGIATDITSRKHAETEKQALKNRLAQAQKMEAVGTLAGGIAHDFNNILAAIIGFTELALEECESESQMAQHLNESLCAGERAKELIKQILAFSRLGETNHISLQPAHILKETIKMLRPSLPTTIEIRSNIEQSGETILADPSQLNQIVMNLCTNAFHAMEKTGGFLDITMKMVVLSGEDLIKEPQIYPGPFIKLSVADSGKGIDQEIRDKIFDPYFTTKEKGKGTGMGLAITHGIVKSYGGFITCYSKPGEGTVFHVFLPVQKSDEIVSDDDDTIVPIGNERILFVDDEKIIVDISRRVLENLGYSVVAITDSEQALAVFREMPEMFDLVITDQTMPGLTGEELARELLQIRAELPIILCTGYSTIITEEKARAMGIKAFALKPLSQKELARLIRKVLDDKQEKSPK